jgi:hypothetical protein
MMLWILIIGLIFVNLFSKSKGLQSVQYDTLFPTVSQFDKQVNNKNIMIIGDDLSLFHQNKLSGYFLDWELSKKYFDQPDVYENVIMINKAILEDAPDAIIDKSGKLAPFVERIPFLKNNYRKENEIYWKR